MTQPNGKVAVQVEVKVKLEVAVEFKLDDEDRNLKLLVKIVFRNEKFTMHRAGQNSPDAPRSHQP